MPDDTDRLLLRGLFIVAALLIVSLTIDAALIAGVVGDRATAEEPIDLELGGTAAVLVAVIVDRCTPCAGCKGSWADAEAPMWRAGDIGAQYDCG